MNELQTKDVYAHCLKQIPSMRPHETTRGEVYTFEPILARGLFPRKTIPAWDELYPALMGIKSLDAVSATVARAWADEGGEFPYAKFIPDWLNTLCALVHTDTFRATSRNLPLLRMPGTCWDSIQILHMQGVPYLCGVARSTDLYVGMPADLMFLQGLNIAVQSLLIPDYGRRVAARCGLLRPTMLMLRPHFYIEQVGPATRLAAEIAANTRSTSELYLSAESGLPIKLECTGSFPSYAVNLSTKMWRDLTEPETKPWVPHVHRR